MPSFRSTVLALAATLVAVTSADYVIDPKSVPLSTRQNWCDNEKQTCPIICQQVSEGSAKVNDCDPDTLTYGCICADGKQPNVSEYTLTLPYFVCQEWGTQCVDACDNNQCASDCRQNHPCGATDPKKYNTTSTASGTATAGPTGSASATTTGADTIYTSVGSGGGSSDDSSSSSGKKSGSAMLEAGRTWGLAVVAGSMFVGFAMI